MCLLFMSEADPLGSGARSCGYVVIDREVVHGMTDWRRFGRAPDFTAKIKDVIAQRRDRRKCVKGSCMGLFAIGFGLCHENWIIPLH